MPGKIRLIAIDLDGTMLNDSKELPEENLRAIDEAGAAGIIVAVATGRTITTVPPELFERPYLRYIMSTNGSAITDVLENRRIHFRPIPHDTALNVLKATESFTCVREFAADGVLFCQEDEEEFECSFVAPELKDFMHAMHRTVPNLMEHFNTLNCDSEKMLVFSAMPEALLSLKKLCEEEYGLTVSYSLDEDLEITAHGVSKAAGLETLAGILGIPMEETMALGDSGNDLEMLKKAGFSVAMGNAAPQVIEAADAVTASNNDCGVAQAIRKYALGR